MAMQAQNQHRQHVGNGSVSQGWTPINQSDENDVQHQKPIHYITERSVTVIGPSGLGNYDQCTSSQKAKLPPEGDLLSRNSKAGE